MTYRTALVALTATCALLTTAACDKPEDESAPPVVTVTSIAPAPGATPSTVWVSPSADASDSGLIACKQIIANVRASKLPLPINEDAAYYVTFKKKFTNSKYADVKDAGEEFVDKYASAIKAGGKNPDANDLSEAATDLVKACQKRM